ncbi:hypothetical protein RQP46_001550 [Phenoliferia psychrophenolica]
MVVHPATQVPRAGPAPPAADESSDAEAEEDETEGESASQKLWPVKEILGEKRNAYLLQWAGIDPSTGEEWKPSWESKDNATPVLVAEWTQKKKDKAKRRRSKGKGRASAASATSTAVPVPTADSSASKKPTKPSSTTQSKPPSAAAGPPSKKRRTTSPLPPHPPKSKKVVDFAIHADDVPSDSEQEDPQQPHHSLETVVPDSQSQSQPLASSRAPQSHVELAAEDADSEDADLIDDTPDSLPPPSSRALELAQMEANDSDDDDDSDDSNNGPINHSDSSAGGVVARSSAPLPAYPLAADFEDPFDNEDDEEEAAPRSTFSEWMVGLGEDGIANLFTEPSVDADSHGGGGQQPRRPSQGGDLPVSNNGGQVPSYYNSSVYTAPAPSNGSAPARAGWDSNDHNGGGGGGGPGNGHAFGGSSSSTKRDYEASAEEQAAANKRARADLAVSPVPVPLPLPLPFGVPMPIPTPGSLSAIAPPSSSSTSFQYLAPVPLPSSHSQLPSPSLSRVQAQSTGDIYVNSPPPPSPSAPAPATTRRSPSPGFLPASAVASPVMKAVSMSSRNGSPAPGQLNKQDALVELINNSSLLDQSDATKDELKRFVRDPTGYILMTDNPLNRRPFWAFALRAAPGDKMDIVIVNTTEGTVQTKRVLGTLLHTFDVARSLSHVPASKAPGTPIRRDPTPVPEPPPPPPPPSAASMPRELLEKEFEALRELLRLREDELVTARPLALEASKLRLEVASLQKSNKSLTASKDANSSDFAYLQRQYSEASNAAVDRANEATVAEAAAARLQGLLDVGLVQRDLFQKGESRKHKEHIERLKLEVKLLKGESRRTEGAIREKAALWDTHVARMKDEEDKIKESQSDLDDDEEPDTLDSSQGVFQCAWRATPSHACDAVLPTREALLEHATAEHLPPPISRLVSSA